MKQTSLILLLFFTMTIHAGVLTHNRDTVICNSRLYPASFNQLTLYNNSSSSIRIDSILLISHSNIRGTTLLFDSAGHSNPYCGNCWDFMNGSYFSYDSVYRCTNMDYSHHDSILINGLDSISLDSFELGSCYGCLGVLAKSQIMPYLTFEARMVFKTANGISDTVLLAGNLRQFGSTINATPASPRKPANSDSRFDLKGNTVRTKRSTGVVILKNGSNPVRLVECR